MNRCVTGALAVLVGAGIAAAAGPAAAAPPTDRPTPPPRPVAAAAGVTEQSCTQQGGVYTQTRDTRTCTTTTTGEYARMGRVWTSFWLFTPSDTHYAEYEIWRATTTTTVTSTTGRTTSTATSTSYSYVQPDEGKSCFEYDTEERGTLYRQDPSECEALGLYDEWERHIPRHRDALALIVDSTNGGWAD